MNYDEVKATFPENTVFLYMEDRHVTRANTSDYYVDIGKTYSDCQNALKTSLKYIEIQDAHLYDVVKMLESANKKIKIWSNIESNILNAAGILNEVIAEMED